MRLAALMAGLLLALSVTVAGGAGASELDEGKLYLRGGPDTPGDLPKAFALFDAAAEQGDAAAAYYLGLMYKNGQATAPDSKAAARCFELAADRGIAPAMFLLANQYLSGEGVPRDEGAARRWIERAAEQNYPEALMAMAMGLRDGSMGFERNPLLSEQQMRLAAHAMQHRPQEP